MPKKAITKKTKNLCHVKLTDISCHSLLRILIKHCKNETWGRKTVSKVTCHHKHCYNNSVNWFHIIGEAFLHNMLNEKKTKNTIYILNSQCTINCVPIVYFLVLVKGENKLIKFNNDTIFFRSDKHLILFFFKFSTAWWYIK